jgi:hypothetical protein
MQTVVTYAYPTGVVAYTKFYQNPLSISEYQIPERQVVILHTQVCVYMLYLERGFNFTILWNDNFCSLILTKCVFYLVVY